MNVVIKQAIRKACRGDINAKFICWNIFNLFIRNNKWNLDWKNVIGDNMQDGEVLYDIENKQIFLENDDLEISIKFKSDRMKKTPSHLRWGILGLDMIIDQLFENTIKPKNAFINDPELVLFRKSMDQMFGYRDYMTSYR